MTSMTKSEAKRIFNNFLKCNGVKSKFIAGFNGEDRDESLLFFLSHTEIKDFISEAFRWINTDDGFVFWLNIDDEWMEIIDDEWMEELIPKSKLKILSNPKEGGIPCL